jgi:imidazoleglycerol phosphate synthase cyclase subunit
VLAKRVVACLDVKDGRVVKGRNFRNLRDAGDPVECALRYRDDGVDELVMLDVSATLEGRLASLRSVEAIADRIDVPFTVGGGVRALDDFRRLLDAGADKVAVNSAALDNPALLAQAAERYGAQCVVLAIDARRSAAGGYELASHSATRPMDVAPLAWALEGARLGAGEILLTSIDRDGTREGFDVEMIAAFAREIAVPLIASGGARDADSFGDAFEAGAHAALGASVFHDGDFTIAAVKARCAERGLATRR